MTQGRAGPVEGLPEMIGVAESFRETAEPSPGILITLEGVHDERLADSTRINEMDQVQG